LHIVAGRPACARGTDDVSGVSANVAEFSLSFAADEYRRAAPACALNNRADILDARGDLADAIADRTAVLALSETTFNLRCIARCRRARTLWRLSRPRRRPADIDVILATDDIVM
jgi:hypothetical protein